MNKQTDSGRVLEKAGLIKIAIDMHLRSYRVVRQIDDSKPQPAQKFSPEAFCGWLAKQREMAERVVVCYEPGCFGYEPARRMQALGVELYVIAPQNWDEQDKGQVNDKHDAQVMCRRLSEYLGGQSARGQRPDGVPAPQSLSCGRRRKLRFLDHHNLNPKPYRWTAGPKRILEKLDRAWEALLEEIYNPVYGTSH
jgi:hypothetical protein